MLGMTDCYLEYFEISSCTVLVTVKKFGTLWFDIFSMCHLAHKIDGRIFLQEVESVARTLVLDKHSHATPRRSRS